MFLRRNSKPEGPFHGSQAATAVLEPEPAVATTCEITPELRIGRTVQIMGDVVAGVDVSIEGDFDGSITLRDHRLTVSSTSCVRADIEARTVVIHGEVFGNITAGDTITIESTGRVHGDIQAPRVILTEGSTVDGSVSTGRPGRHESQRSLRAERAVPERPERVSRVVATSWL